MGVQYGTLHIRPRTHDNWGTPPEPIGAEKPLSTMSRHLSYVKLHAAHFQQAYYSDAGCMRQRSKRMVLMMSQYAWL